MPRDPVQNALLRDKVRADFTLPLAFVFAPPTEPPADTSEEKLSSLRAAGFAPSAADLARAAARAEDEARRRLTFPGAAQLLAFNAFTAVAGSNWFFTSVGPLSFPYTVTDAYFSTAAVTAINIAETRFFAILASRDRSIDLGALQADQNLVASADAHREGIRGVLVQFTGSNHAQVNIPIGTNISNTPTFLKVGVNNLGVGFIVPTVVITIKEQTIPAAIGGLFIPPVPRFNLNLNTAPTTPRTPQPTNPRGARITTTQGGRILSERIVAWPALTPELKAQYFAEQLGQPPDPNVQWLP